MGDGIERNEAGEITVLGHKPWPGYRKAFYIAFAVGIGYLLLAFGGLFGWIYLSSGRNLWITIVGHGLLNTLRFSLLYYGLG